MGSISIEGSSFSTDFGLCFLTLVLGLGWGCSCSSHISCCFLLRYSCFINSLLAFSSSFLILSSSAFLLELGEKRGFKHTKSMKKCRASLYHFYIPGGWHFRGCQYLASSLFSSLSASICCLRSRASSAFLCCFSRNAARFLANSSSAFCSSYRHLTTKLLDFYIF